MKEWDESTPAQPGPVDREDRMVSAECERGVLGCILLAPMECLDDCEQVGVVEEWFHDLRHQNIYHAMRRLASTGTPIEVATLQNWLRTAGLLESVGGLPYLSVLPDSASSAENLFHYLDIVREKYHAREAARMFSEGLQDLRKSESPPQVVLAQLQRELETLSERATTIGETQVRSLVDAVIDKLENNYHRGSAQMSGLSTGLEYLDKILCGIGGDNGNMVVISARPGTGKTSLALQIVLHAALDHVHYTPQLGPDGKQLTEKTDKGEKRLWNAHRGVPAFVFSLEMSSDALTQRLLFQRAMADMQRFRNGFALEEDFKGLAKAAGEVGNAKIWIDDAGRCTIDELKAKARRAVRQYGIKLFVVDYIQLIKVGRRDRRIERREELEEISGELFKLGKELNVPFVILAQMNRDYEKEPNRLPRLSDLKDCGAIEQDADVIMFLAHPIVKKSKESEEDVEQMLQQVYGKDWVKRKRVDMLVAKNRHGMADATCQLLFAKASTVFLDWNLWKKKHGYKETAKGEKKVEFDPAPGEFDDK